MNAFGPEDEAFPSQCALLLEPLWNAEQAVQTDPARQRELTALFGVLKRGIPHE
jgi:hypothetical protein